MERLRRVFSTQSYKHRTRRNHAHDDKLSFCRQPHRKLEWLGVREENRKGERWAGHFNCWEEETAAARGVWWAIQSESWGQITEGEHLRLRNSSFILKVHVGLLHWEMLWGKKYFWKLSLQWWTQGGNGGSGPFRGCRNETRVICSLYWSGSCGPDGRGVWKEGLTAFDDRLVRGVWGILEEKKLTS